MTGYPYATAVRRRGGLRRLARLLLGPTMGEHPGRWAWRVAASAGALAAAVGGLVHLVLAVYAYRVPFPQLWVVLTAALAIPWILRTLGTQASEPEPPPDPGLRDLRQRPFAQADRWQQRLSVTSGDVEWFDRVARARLVTLVAERLWQRHGVPFHGDPARTRATLGEELYEFLTAPLPRTPTPYELDLLVNRIEEL